MFEINKTQVNMYSRGKYISYILANIEDQTYETIMALGRGRMYDCISTSGLKYSLPGGLVVFLRTD